MSKPLDISYLPPRGKPLGTNAYFKFGASIVIPILNLISKKVWKGGENIPKSGPMIAVCNHISYLDPLTFTHFLYRNGRAPRYLGKASLFRLPIIGHILKGAGQIPVERETTDANRALHHAVAFLKAGHCLGVYPEGTLTRDADIWPMKGKTGVARLAIITKTKITPCAQWGAQEIIPPYSKKIKFFPRTKVFVTAGEPFDLSNWYGKEDDPAALEEATEFVMNKITSLLMTMRSGHPPQVRFDPKKSDLPRIGNFKKKKA